MGERMEEHPGKMGRGHQCEVNHNLFFGVLAEQSPSPGKHKITKGITCVRNLGTKKG